MECTIRYPALVTGTARGSKTVLQAVVLQTDTLTIPELNETDAPVAFTVRLERGNQANNQTDTEMREIRIVEHNLFVRSVIGTSGSVTENDILGPHGLGIRVGQEIAKAIGHISKQGGGRQEVLAGSYTLEKQFMANPSTVLAIEEITAGFVPDANGLDEIEAWRERMLREMSSFVVIGNELWERCDEPVYRVNVRGTPEIIVEARSGLSRGMAHDRLGDLAAYTRVFNALEYDLALQALQAADAFAKPHGISSNDFIEVHLPHAVRFDSIEFGLVSIARTMVMDVARQMADGVAKRGATWISGYPSQVIFRWTLLRDELDAYDASADKDPDEMEDLIGDLAKALKRVPSHLGVPLMMRVRSEDIRHCLNRWEDRPLEVAGALALEKRNAPNSVSEAPRKF